MQREQAIRSQYLSRLQSKWIDAPKVIQSPGDWYPTTTLQCKLLPNNPGSNPTGFSFGSKWQYSVTTEKTRVRYAAYRIPFITKPGFSDDSMTVSHLCHNNECMNPDHHVLESLAANKGRNGCPAGAHCHHKVKCIMPGPYYDA